MEEHTRAHAARVSHVRPRGTGCQKGDFRCETPAIAFGSGRVQFVERFGRQSNKL